ncbi:hypothetical protein MLD38_017552 [Melastoma candidum]|uniref:Uncharacterized protein n=1 Tax=Melastoma candidum TaxID=119954 RepID=A0ACB9QQ67_9MYRT|nr:hypothetical protein MLD38_017552 [Melastoma candidum]
MTSPSSLVLATLFVALPILALAQDDFPQKPNITGKGFVIVCCAQTPHPDVCYSTFGKRFNATRDDYGCIARMAMRLALKDAQALSANLTALLGSASGPAKAGIEGCVEDVAVVTSKLSATVEKLVQARGWTGTPLENTVHEIDSWITAATASEQACADRLKGLSVSQEVVDGIDAVSVGTANAMGLVYYYDAVVGSSSSPQDGFDYAEPAPIGPDQ